MAFLFFTTEKIKEIDIRRIPNSFKAFYESVSDQRKAEIKQLRPDIIKALYPSETREQLDPAAVDTSDFVERIMDQWESMPANAWNNFHIETKVVVCKVIPDGLKRCRIHRIPLENKQLNIKHSKGGVFYVSGKFCPECFDFFLEEKNADNIARTLSEWNTPTLIQPLSITLQEWDEEIVPIELDETTPIYIPEQWVDGSPMCPVHNQAQLIPDRYQKKYKDREISFDAYYCPNCKKVLLRNADAQRLENECGDIGIPIEFLPIREEKKTPEKKRVIIKPDFFVQNGRKQPYDYKSSEQWPLLSEEDTVVVSFSRECPIEEHDGETEDVLAIISVQGKKADKIHFLTLMGYCESCGKFYLDLDDFKLISETGRPIITVFDDTGTYNTITSGPVFAKERDHLEKVEKDLQEKIDSIKSLPGYVGKYATINYYDDGDLHWKKAQSEELYQEIGRISDLKPQPYRYRVDLISGEKRIVYYLGAEDILYNSARRITSFNSQLGRTLVNYRTVEMALNGKKWKVKRRREYDIEQAKLFGFTEVSDEDAIFRAGITDPFLINVLNTRKRQHQLVDIISTIQENQNEIVDQPFERNIIVQGCAGSGKTMVLLHRLSALKYNHREFDFSKAVILTPNGNFNTHIQNLAASLQIGIISRYSVEEYYRLLLQRYDEGFAPGGKIADEMAEDQDYIDFLYSENFFVLFTDMYKRKMEEYRSLCLKLNEVAGQLGRRDSAVIPQTGYALLTELVKVQKAVDDSINLYEADYREATRVLQREREKHQEVEKNIAELEERLTVNLARGAVQARAELVKVADENSAMYRVLQDEINEAEQDLQKSEEDYNKAEENLNIAFTEIMQVIESALVAAQEERSSKQEKIETELEEYAENRIKLLEWNEQANARIQTDIRTDGEELIDKLLTAETAVYESVAEIEGKIKEKESEQSSIERRFFVTRKAEKIEAVQQEILAFSNSILERQAQLDEIHWLMQKAEVCSQKEDFYELVKNANQHLTGEEFLPESVLEQDFIQWLNLQEVNQLEEEEERIKEKAAETASEIETLEEMLAEQSSVTADTLPNYLKKADGILQSTQYYLEQIRPLRREAHKYQEEVEEHRSSIEELQKLAADCKEKAALCETVHNQLQEKVTTDNYDEFFEAVISAVPEARVQFNSIKQQIKSLQAERDTKAALEESIQKAALRLTNADKKRIDEDIRVQYSLIRNKDSVLTPLAVYQAVFSSLFDSENSAVDKRYQKAQAQSRGIHRVDLYLQLRFAMMFYGRTTGQEQLVCIDEGQDLTPSEYSLIRDINNKKAVFNIFGDTNQLLKTKRGISDWARVSALFYQPVKHTLNENYRNTNQITKYCNDYFHMSVLQTGADGKQVKEIDRSRLEQTLSELNPGESRLAIIVPRTVKKESYIDRTKLPQSINDVIGTAIGKGLIAVVYVDEIKGVEFDRVFVVPNGMSKNEKYIAFTRALSELTIVVDKDADIKKTDLIESVQENKAVETGDEKLASYVGIEVGKVIKRKKRNH